MAYKSKIMKFTKISGFRDRWNDILYIPPEISATTSKILIFFCGDMQDLNSNMLKHQNSVRYRYWNLEKTAELMTEQFPQNHIIVIRPSRRSIYPSAILNCFDNFVQGNQTGSPSFSPNYNSLLHLKILLGSLSMRLSGVEKLKEDTEQIANEGKLSLVGFSKGCIVLNQFLHEFHYFKNNEEKNIEMEKFISRIDEMRWLDGGHSGRKDTWITDKTILETFIKMGIDVYVHVTPYQIKDTQRPWIKIEEQTFSDTLEKGGANIKRFIHFKDEPRKLERHFRVLSQIGSVMQ